MAPSLRLANTGTLRSSRADPSLESLSMHTWHGTGSVVGVGRPYGSLPCSPSAGLECDAVANADIDRRRDVRIDVGGGDALFEAYGVGIATDEAW